MAQAVTPPPAWGQQLMGFSITTKLVLHLQLLLPVVAIIMWFKPMAEMWGLKGGRLLFAKLHPCHLLSELYLSASLSDISVKTLQPLWPRLSQCHCCSLPLSCLLPCGENASLSGCRLLECTQHMTRQFLLGCRLLRHGFRIPSPMLQAYLNLALQYWYDLKHAIKPSGKAAVLGSVQRASHSSS